MDNTIKSRRGSTSSAPNRLGGSIFSGLFLFAGSLFLYFISLDMVNSAPPYFWQRAICEVVSVAPAFDDTGAPVVSYRYLDGSRTRTGHRFTRAPKASRQPIEVITALYPPGSQHTCYFNPDSPEQAVLDRPYVPEMLVSLFPLPFILIGVYGLAWTWLTPRERPSTYSPQATPIGFRRVTALTGLGLLCLSGFLIYAVVGIEFLRLYDAQSWPQKECTVTFSQLESRSTDDGTNYVGHLIYSWETKGSQYSSARRSFFGNVGGTRSEIQEYLDAHPVGSKIACFLDPATPTEAVLERGFRLKMSIGLIPFFAFFIGYRMFVWGIRRPQSPFASRSTVTAVGPNGTSMSIGVSGPLELKPEISRSTSFVGTLFFALVWNGIVSIFLYNIYKDWGSSGIHWGIALFMFPFVVIGVLLIVAVPFAFLGMFSPKLNLRVNSGVVRVGDRMQLSWNVDGKAERVSKLTFELIGQEEATYRRGTDSVTDKNVFFTAQQSTTNVSGSLARGEISFEIPATTVPSFQSPSGNNKIAWSVKVTGEVIRFPNFTDVYPIPVFPLTKEGLSKHVQSSS